MVKKQNILYCHGFNSSAQAQKAQQFQAALLNTPYQAHVPNLAYDPEVAFLQLHQLMQRLQPVMLVGSSLGGFYATVLAEQYQCPAVLLNPSVTPAHTLQAVVNQIQYSAAQACDYTFLPAYVETLARQTPTQIDPQRYFVVLTTGDEVLDYRAAQTHYDGCAGLIISGNTHQIAHFEDFLPPIMRFIDERCAMRI